MLGVLVLIGLAAAVFAGQLHPAIEVEFAGQFGGQSFVMKRALLVRFGDGILKGALRF